MLQIFFDRRQARVGKSPFAAAYDDDEHVLANTMLLATLVSLVCGLALTPRLWSSSVQLRFLYPLAPLLDWTSVWPPLLLDIAFALSFGAIVALLSWSIAARRLRAAAPLRLVGLLVAVMMFMLVGDQNRNQPWVFHYCCGMAALAAAGDATAQLDAWHVITSFVIFWAGLHKLTPLFADVFVWFVSPLPDMVGLERDAMRPLAPVAALIETSIGLMLLSSRFRFVGALLGVSLFAFNLVMLALVHRANSAVWPWNLFMIVSIYVLFIVRKSRSTTLLERIGAVLRRARTVALALLLVVVCPALFTVGMWDAYPSFVLYSGNHVNMEITLDHRFVARFPDLRGGWNDTGLGRRKLPVVTWGYESVNVPPYLAERVYRAEVRELCAWADGDSDVQFRVKPQLVMLMPWMDHEWPNEWENCANLTLNF